ncbi:MAG TPA: site-2 protease family protein [Gaiellaceae bacterium]|nr:site-2 protease family protein [Gaiellaceae bacterium]
MNSLIAILGLAFLVLLHEAGHFYTARAVGMRPRKFYVGFPPAIAKVRRGGIEYGIGAIPLGGYVKIPGMHRPAPSEVDAHFGRAIQEAPQLIGPAERLKRLFAEGDFDGAAGALKALERAAQDADLTPAAHGGIQRGVTEISDALGLDAYWRQRTWKKIAVIGAGPGTNLVFAMLMFALLLFLGPGRATTTVDDVERQVRPGQPTPAAQIGLRPRDRIVAINGTRVDASKMFELIVESKGEPVSVTVERNGRRVVLGPVRPFKDTDGSYRIGFRPQFEDLPVTTAVGESFRLTWLITKEIGGVLGRLVQGSGREEISSPIGIVRGSSDALDRGWETYLWVLGLISLSLALLNLLPLLPLDGGHIAFSIIEGVRGRAVGREVYERVSVVGIALVLMLFFIGLSNDIGGRTGG